MINNHDYYVYILSSTSGTLYIGVTNNLERRIVEHKQKLIPGFTQTYNCNKLVFYEHFKDIKQAIAREKYLKGKSRKFKQELIKTINSHWKDLSEDWDCVRSLRDPSAVASG